MPNFVWIGLFFRHLVAKNSIFCHFFGLWHLWCHQLVAIWDNWTLMHNYKLHLSSSIKIISVLHRFHVKIMHRTSDIQKQDGHTQRPTDKPETVGISEPLKTTAACTESLSGPDFACDSGSLVCAYRLNFIWIDVLCCPCWAKNTEMSQFWPNFYIMENSCAHPPLPICAKFFRKQ